MSSKRSFSTKTDFTKRLKFSAEIVLTFPWATEYEGLADKLKKNFEALGIKTKTLLLDWLFFESLNRKELFMFTFSWIVDYSNLEAILTPFFALKEKQAFYFIDFLNLID